MGAVIRCLFVCAIVASAAVAAPSFARDIWGDGAGVQVGPERAMALRYCNDLARATYRGYDNGPNRDRFYKACMASHGQVE